MFVQSDGYDDLTMNKNLTYPLKKQELLILLDINIVSSNEIAVDIVVKCHYDCSYIQLFPYVESWNN